jgi:hypothetical protein
MTSRGLHRTKSVLALVAMVLAITAIPGGAQADVVTDTVNGALLPADCDIVAHDPTRLGNSVRSSARVECNNHRDAILIEVCTQFRQPAVTEDFTWKQHGVCGNGRTGDGGGRSASAPTSNPCLPGTWSYRTIATAEIHKNDNVVRNGTGIDISGTVTFTCAID